MFSVISHHLDPSLFSEIFWEPSLIFHVPVFTLVLLIVQYLCILPMAATLLYPSISSPMSCREHLIVGPMTDTPNCIHQLSSRLRWFSLPRLVTLLNCAMAPPRRRPLTSLQRWQQIGNRLLFWMANHMQMMQGLMMFYARPALMDEMTAEFHAELEAEIEDDSEDEMLMLYLPTHALTTKALGKVVKEHQSQSYQNEPETCTHYNGRRKYNAPAQGGVRANYEICDLCGQRWMMVNKTMVRIAPKAAPNKKSPVGPKPSGPRKTSTAWTGRPAVVTSTGSPTEEPSAPSGSSSQPSSGHSIRCRRSRARHSGRSTSGLTPSSPEEFVMNTDLEESSESGVFPDHDGMSMSGASVQAEEAETVLPTSRRSRR